MTFYGDYGKYVVMKSRDRIEEQTTLFDTDELWLSEQVAPEQNEKHVVELVGDAQTDGHYGIDETGDVVPYPDDEFDDNFAVNDDDAYEAMMARDDEIASIRELSPFNMRNARLHAGADKIASGNRAAGAYKQLMQGNQVTDKFSTAGGAYDVLVLDHEIGRQQIAAACAACALREYCNLTPVDLTRRLASDAKASTRFRNRVKSRDNNHFCETNLQHGRQNKTIA